ncbi:hypothetical protein CBL_07449 [Carabus blaptoides fortunei]
MGRCVRDRCLGSSAYAAGSDSPAVDVCFYYGQSFQRLSSGNWGFQSVKANSLAGGNDACILYRVCVIQPFSFPLLVTLRSLSTSFCLYKELEVIGNQSMNTSRTLALEICKFTPTDIDLGASCAIR